MAIDFKNIVFKFVKITGGTARIDADMTEKIFNSTKPSGVYRCFIFPKNYFGGYDYEDVQNLVAIEESDMWNKTNRDAFLGFNEETNEFIVNYNAWLSLKDSDLKTDGELPHPSQAGWFVTTLSTSKSTDSKFELNQSDNSKVYLSIKPYKVESVDVGSAYVYPSVCVESKLKSVLNQSLYKKDDGLFAKCADDNSVLMVEDCVKTISVKQFNRPSRVSTLYRDNKEYGYSPNRLASTYKYCKKIFSFASTSSTNPINNAYTTLFLQNKTSSTDIELVHTSNFDDILASGESLTFSTIPKTRDFRFIYDKSSSAPFKTDCLYSSQKIFYNFVKYNSNQTFSSYIDKSIEGISCDLISCDTRKAFVYDPLDKNILINGFGASDSSKIRHSIKTSNFIKNIPDGFIFLVKTVSSILRFKKGEPVKVRSSNDSKFVTISGSVQFGDSIIDSDNNQLTSTTISKNDVINGVGFTDISGSSVVYSSINYSTFMITVLRV